MFCVPPFFSLLVGKYWGKGKGEKTAAINGGKSSLSFLGANYSRIPIQTKNLKRGRKEAPFISSSVLIYELCFLLRSKAPSLSPESIERGPVGRSGERELERERRNFGTVQFGTKVHTAKFQFQK